MKKIIVALMLCFVSITCSALVSSLHAFGFLKSTGECVPKSYDYQSFSPVEWTLLSDKNQMVLVMGENSQYIFIISNEYNDTQKGIRVYDAIETTTGSRVKLYLYLHEAATQGLNDRGMNKSVYELDMYDYMNRIVISVLLIDLD